MSKNNELKLKLTDFNYRDEKQERLMAFMLKVLKSFREGDFEIEKYGKRMKSLIPGQTAVELERKQNILEFKASIENWLRIVFFKFSVKEINFLFSMANKYRDTQDTKSWLLDCVGVVPREEESKPKIKREGTPQKVQKDVKVEFEDDLFDEKGETPLSTDEKVEIDI